MSTNLDLVRSIYADWERGDFSRGDWVDPEVEYVSVDGPDPGRWSGVAGMVEANRYFLSAWSEWRIRAEEFRELDGGRVLALTHRSGRGKASGLDISEPSANLLQIRDGKVTRLVFYWDRDRAFADLGLTPEGEGA